MNTDLKKVVWLILGAIVVLGAISAWIESRLGGEARQVVADTRQTMRAQGFKTDLADFNVTNDAATQARAEALDLIWKAPELETNEDALELLPAVSNDTATVIWKQNSFKIWKIDWPKIGSNVLHWPDLHVLLDTNRWILDQASGAALSGPIRFDAQATNGANMFRFQELTLPSLALALSRCTMLDLHDGHPDSAWTNLLTVTRLVTASVPAPDMDSQCFHLTLAGTVFANTWQVLQQGDWPDEKLAVLQQEWESAIFFTNFVETAATEYAYDVFACHYVSKGNWSTSFSFSGLAQEALVNLSSGREYLSDHVALELYRQHGVFTDEKGLLLHFQARALELRRAVQTTNWAEMRALPGVTNPVPFKSPYPPANELIKCNHLADNSLPALAADAEARRRVLITALAVERYRGKHGAYPATLALLAPEFLRTVPMDFMDGQPLHYRLTDDGHFVLYSVGLDCVDNGGMTSDPSAPQWIERIWQNPGGPTNEDIVWPRPEPIRTPANRP